MRSIAGTMLGQRMCRAGHVWTCVICRADMCGRVLYAAPVKATFTLKYAFHKFSTCLKVNGNTYRLVCEHL